MIQPVGDRILVEPIITIENRIGTILLPESVRMADAPAEAIVIKVGTGKVNKKGVRTQFEVKEGDRVFFSRFNGTEVVSGSRKFKLLEPRKRLNQNHRHSQRKRRS